MLPLQKILCPIDFSDASFAAMKQAGELAQHFGASLVVLHVLTPLAPEIGAEVYMASRSYEDDNLAATQRDLQAAVAQSAPVGVETHVLTRIGRAADEIVAAAEIEEADLIVIATHGLTGWRHLVFGSVAEQVVRSAPCAVLTIHAEAARAANEKALDHETVAA